MVLDLLFLSDLENNSDALEVALTNLHYLHGANPWGVSMQVGIGTRNLNHVHNRAANSEFYNQGAYPYATVPLTGAICGGAGPTSSLVDDVSSYTNSESCLDFAATAELAFSLLTPSSPSGLPNSDLEPAPTKPGVTVHVIVRSSTTNPSVIAKIENGSTDTIPTGAVLRFWGSNALGTGLFQRSSSESLMDASGMFGSSIIATLGSWVSNGELSSMDITVASPIVPNGRAELELTYYPGENCDAMPWSALASSWSMQGIDTSSTLRTNGNTSVQWTDGKCYLTAQEATNWTLDVGGTRLWGRAPNDPVVRIRAPRSGANLLKPTWHYDLLGRLQK